MMIMISKYFVPTNSVNFMQEYAVQVWINSILENLLEGEDDGIIKRESAFDYTFIVNNHHATLTKNTDDLWWFKLCCDDGGDECLEDVYSFIHMLEEPTPLSPDIEESLVMETDDFNYNPDDSFNWNLHDNELNWNLQEDDFITEEFDAADDLNGSDTERTVIPLQFGEPSEIYNDDYDDDDDDDDDDNDGSFFDCSDEGCAWVDENFNLKCEIMLLVHPGCACHTLNSIATTDINQSIEASPMLQKKTY
ncbi:uncharacterized protein LOC141537087 [Cotesia typhae]|uniref:uncharacterized protein LOC141537087 n=1 Tax=Cotesia typhae TaxID=2053667 RepID=UPI003D68DFF2